MNNLLKKFYNSMKIGKGFWINLIAYFILKTSLALTTSVAIMRYWPIENYQSPFMIAGIFLTLYLPYIFLFQAHVWFKKELKRKSISISKLHHFLVFMLPFITIPYFLNKWGGLKNTLTSVFLFVTTIVALYGVFYEINFLTVENYIKPMILERFKIIQGIQPIE